MRGRFAACAILAASAIVAIALRGQTTNSAHGRVLDASGRPVPGALVALRGASSVVTGADGTWSITVPDPAANYAVTADKGALTSRPRMIRAGDSIDLKLLPPIQFEDIAPRAGINFTLNNGATGHFYQPEIMLGGVAAFDYNNDGCMDIFFTNGAELPSMKKSGPEFHNRLYRNNCDRTFTDITDKAGLAGAGYSMGVAAGDYDNDGFVDLLVTGLASTTLYRNRGDGTFEDVTVKSGVASPLWSVSAGWFDYDNDGFPDLFVADYVEWKPTAEPECSEAGGKPFYCHPRVYRPLPNRLYHNNHDGTFTDVSEKSGIAAHLGKGMGVAFGDFNADGLLDVFVANDSVPNFLFENQGNGTFKEVALERGVAYAFHGAAVAGMGADFRDYNEDGLDDIALDAMYFDTFPLYRNTGKPAFFADDTVASGVAVATRNLTGWGMGLFDFDNDGHKDLFFATSHFPGSEPNVHSDAAIANHVLRNTSRGPGDTHFEDVSEGAGRDFQRPGLYHGAAFADFDNDGRVDVVVTGVNSYARLFRNVSPEPGHWLALRLTGTRSNRDGLGARVRATLPDGTRLYNRSGTSVGYASSSEPLVRFGLGTASTVTELVIEWPGRNPQTLRNIKGDQVLDVKEPQ